MKLVHACIWAIVCVWIVCACMLSGSRTLAQEVDQRDDSAKTAASEPTIEHWFGILQVGATKLRLRIDVYPGEDGKPTGNLVSLDQGGTMIPLDSLTITDQEWSFTVQSHQIQYKGSRDKSAKTVDGKFQQGQLSIDVTFNRLTDEEATPNERPQTPTEPFPYDVKEVKFENNLAEGVTLAGSLTVPHDTKGKPMPAVVLVSGSGPQDRDESLLGHKPFWVIADHLSRHGVVVLRFDDRGIGASTGDFSSATTADFMTDAQAAIDYLRSHPEVDARRIGVIGHSEGGIIAAAIAASNTPPAHVIMLAGPGLPGDEVLLSQGEALVARSGAKQPEIAKQLSKDLIALSKAGASLEKLHQRVDQFVQESALTDNSKDSSDGDAPADGSPPSSKETSDAAAIANLKAGVENYASPWFRYFFKHDPRNDLRRAKCPVYALIGENDLQVLADLNLPEIEKALAESGTQGHRHERLDGLNHLFQHSETGLPSDYGIIVETFAPEVLDRMVAWIASH